MAATHQLLTELLLYTMRKVQIEGLEQMVRGSYTFEDTHILEDLHTKNIGALEDIIGVRSDGVRRASRTSNHLRKLGAYWSLHVLEGVYSWILVFCYIMATVVSGYALVSGIAVTIEPGISRTNTANSALQAVAYVLAIIDGFIYVFSPQWCCLLLRLVQVASAHD